jgi:hypothetical protein
VAPLANSPQAIALEHLLQSDYNAAPEVNRQSTWPSTTSSRLESRRTPVLRELPTQGLLHVRLKLDLAHSAASQPDPASCKSRG